MFQHFAEQQDGDGLGAIVSGPSKGEVYYSDEEDEDEESRDKARKALEQSGMTRRQKRQAAVGQRRVQARVRADVWMVETHRV